MRQVSFRALREPESNHPMATNPVDPSYKSSEEPANNSEFIRTTRASGGLLGSAERPFESYSHHAVGVELTTAR
jgi:hypothetical protein